MVDYTWKPIVPTPKTKQGGPENAQAEALTYCGLTTGVAVASFGFEDSPE